MSTRLKLEMVQAVMIQSGMYNYYRLTLYYLCFSCWEAVEVKRSMLPLVVHSRSPVSYKSTDIQLPRENASSLFPNHILLFKKRFIYYFQCQKFLLQCFIWQKSSFGELHDLRPPPPYFLYVHLRHGVGDRHYPLPSLAYAMPCSMCANRGSMCDNIFSRNSVSGCQDYPVITVVNWQITSPQ